MKNYIRNMHLLDFNVYDIRNWGIFIIKLVAILDGMVCVGMFGWLFFQYIPDGDWTRVFLSALMVFGGAFLVAIYPLIPYKR